MSGSDYGSRADPLSRTARNDPDGEALLWPDGSWSWAVLDGAATRVARRLADSLARAGVRIGGAARSEPGGGRRTADAARGSGSDGPEALRARGLRAGGLRETTEGPVVAALLPRSPGAIAGIHGVRRAGAVLAPLHRRWTNPERAAALRRLRPDLLLVPRGETVGWPLGTDAPPVLTLEETFEAPRGRRDAPPTERAREGAPDGPPEMTAGASREGTGRIAAVVSTSGSTGRPRLVVLGEDNLDASARGVRRALDLRPADRWLASLALSHVGGLALVLRAAAVGSAVVLPPPGTFDPVAWSRLLDGSRVSHISLVPTMLRRLLEAWRSPDVPPALRCVLLGGAAVPPPLLDRALEAGVPVATTYGLTEAASQVATAPPDLVRRKPGTSGPPLPGTELDISEEGEILVRGPTVGPGYWDEGARNRVAGDWLRTGDLGRLDPDGHLWVEGRRSGRIVTGGVNVDPLEVEAVLAAHPAVREAVVVALPDDEWGERVAAAVELEGTADPDLQESLESFCRRRLSGPKRPRRWHFPEALPRTPTGKADRLAARSLFPDEPDPGG